MAQPAMSQLTLLRVMNFSSNASRENTGMNFMKEFSGMGSTSCGDRFAIRADQKSYSHSQLLHLHIIRVDSKNENYNLGGARIGIVANPSAEFVAGILGTWLSGGVAVPLALSYPETELMHVMNDSDISMILSTEDYSELMQNVAAKTSALFSLISLVADASLRVSEDNELHKKELDKFEDLFHVQGCFFVTIM
ncbi:malonate--CoA ligase-like [Impatiens glandulifera]|uniref:malonate--CoA ligase-like n=1 Tax=Impatiens glandulifera TaxID=253017 RepID=UPI001FB14C3B|nr:malonate--CoA ligase-like [Impatiens glandulifera]